MSQILTIPDDLYAQLEEAARRHRVTIEGLLHTWQIKDQGDQDGAARDEELRRRQAAVARLQATRAVLTVRYGEMPDSADLVREDRAQ